MATYDEIIQKVTVMLGDPRCHGIFQNATEEVAELVAYSRSDRIIITVLLPILLALGTLLNLTFIYVVFRVQGMKTITNACLINLAVAYIIFLLSAMTKRLWLYTHSGNSLDVSPIGMPGCIIFNFTTNTSYFASLCFVTLVSFERYESVCKPHKNRNNSSVPKNFRLLLLCIWIFTMCFSLTFIPDHTRCDTICMLWPNRDEYANYAPFFVRCKPNLRGFVLYSNFAQVVPFFTAFVVNVILYAKIIIGLNVNIERSSLENKKDRNLRLRNQVAWMLIVSGTVFFLCLSPFEFVSLLQGCLDIVRLVDEDYSNERFDDDTLTNLSKIVLPISYFHPVVNPILYIAMSSRYREAFKSVFAPGVRRLYRKPNQNGSPTSTVNTFLDICRESKL